MSKDETPIRESERDTISALYHASPSAEPPERLDKAILSASKQDIKPNRRAMGPFSGRWQVPTSMAAVLIIAVVLAPLLKHESEMPHSIPRTTPSQSKPPAPINKGSEFDREAAPIFSPHELEKYKSVAPPEPINQAPTRITPEKKEMRPTSKEFRMSPAEANLGKYEAGTGEDTQSTHPERWLASIRRLREASRNKQARTQLRLFLRRYPDYPIESSLRKLLEKSEPGIPD